MRRRLAALTAALLFSTTSLAGCSPAPAPTTTGAGEVRIDLRSPQGIRARQVMDMLNSDWPIGTATVATLAAADRVDEVTAVMESLWMDRPFTLTGVDFGPRSAALHVVTSYGARQDVEIRTNSDSLVDRFRIRTTPPPIRSWRDVDTVLAGTGARYSYQAARVRDGGCDRIAGTNTAESLPLASIFKLYVLLAVAEAIKAKTLSWEDRLTVTDHARVVGSAGLDELPNGARVSVRTAAEQMIASSDNMATDLLIARVGTGAVERALVQAGHHDPASMTPFPTMYELFSVGWGRPDLREQWRHGSPQDRATLLRQVSSRPYEPDPARAHVPASEYGAEWYGSAEDICRVHVALQTGAVGDAAPVREILAAVSGIDLRRADWPYVGAKAGGLPGDLTFSWYAVDRSGQPWVVSFQLNWPRDHGKNLAGWVLQVARQVFGLLPADR